MVFVDSIASSRDCFVWFAVGFFFFSNLENLLKTKIIKEFHHASQTSSSSIIISC